MPTLPLPTRRFNDAGPKGDYIPNSIATVVSAGATVDTPLGLFGSLRLRYFGPRPLVEDDSVESRSSLTLNSQIGYRFKRWMLALDVLNLLDARVNDIEYFYTSRLRGEPAAGVDDIHLHPAEPRTFRASATVRF